MKTKPDPEILSVNEEKYMTFFENSLDAIMITAKDGTIYSANPAACSMLGYDEKDLCKLERKNLTEQNSQLKEALKIRKESGKYLGEVIFIKKDGSRFPAEISSSVFTNTDGSEQTAMIIRDITDRKKTEELLVESEKLLKSIIDSTNDLIWSVDPVSYRLLTFNKALETFFQSINIHIDKGMLLNEIVPGELVKRLSDFYSKTLMEGSLFAEYQTTLGNLTLKLNMHLLSRDGKPFAISVFAKDVTIQKRSESELKQASEWQEAVFEGSLDAIFISDRDARLIAVNNAACDLTGYSREHLLTMSIPDLHEENDLEAFKKHNKRIFSGEKVLSEAKILRQDGIKIDTEFNNSCICISGKSYMHTSARDITDRKKLEKEMNSASLYARSLIEASLDPLVTIDMNGKITDVNFATEEITGIKREKLIGSDFADYFSRPERARKVYQTLFSRGVVKDYPLTIKHSGGTKTEVLYNAALFKNKAGEIQEVFAAARDITDQKRLQSDLKRSKELLEKLNRRLDEIREDERTKISRDLHDQLGQSLTAIKMDLIMLLRDFPSGFDEVRTKINEVIERVTTTSTDVQRISSELRPPILDDLGLSSALEWYCEEFGNRSGLNISVALEDVKTDDIKKDLTMYRVLQESLTNIVRHADAVNVWVKLYQNRNFIVLSIKDDGIGIPVDRINSLKSLGLLGMSERLKQVKGRFEILSPKKGGTIIRIYMPTTKKL